VLEINGVRPVWRVGEEHTGFKLLKPEGKIPFGRPRRRWKEKILK
jgi:hypothetical protein